jgi:hypothetical protein
VTLSLSCPTPLGSSPYPHSPAIPRLRALSLISSTAMAMDGQIIVGIIELCLMLLFALLPIQLIYRRLGCLQTSRTQSDVESGSPARALPTSAASTSFPNINCLGSSEFQSRRDDSAIPAWMPCRPSPVFAPLRNVSPLR